MKLRSPARELAAIAVVAAVLMGAQVVAHVFFPLDDAPDVWLGGILKPGMTEAAARSVLDKRYELVKGAEEKYCLRVKDGLRLWTEGVSSQRTEGAVWFHQGKLTRLSHDFYRADAGRADATAFATAVHAAVDVVTHLSHERPCKISSETRRSSTAEVKETDISCSRRMVRILVSCAPASPTAQLQVSEEIK